MKNTREEFEPWLRRYLRKRYPELEPAMLAVIDAFDTIQNDQRINSELLGKIVEAASSSRRPLCENATGFLATLLERHAEAQEAVAMMAGDSRNRVRFNAISCLRKSTPRTFALQLIRQGLRDRSAIVRAHAAKLAGRFLRMCELVPELEEAVSQEKNAEAKARIEFELKLLRDGHILERWPDDRFDVATFSQSGIASRLVQRSELERRGLEAILAELRRR